MTKGIKYPWQAAGNRSSIDGKSHVCRLIKKETSGICIEYAMNGDRVKYFHNDAAIKEADRRNKSNNY